LTKIPFLLIYQRIIQTYHSLKSYGLLFTLITVYQG